MLSLRSQEGITYIQVIFPIVFAGIVAALAVPYLTESQRQEIETEAFSRLARIAEAQEQWYTIHGTFTEEVDSLRTLISDPEVFINPVDQKPITIETANQGQEYSIFCPGFHEELLLVTEDRWPQFMVAFRIYQQEQQRLADEEAARRAGRPPPRR